MRVLIVSGESISKIIGGIGSVVFEMCKELDKRKIFYKVVYSDRFKFETAKGLFIRDAPPPLSPLGITFGLNFKRFLKKEKDNWDIVHFHLPSALWPSKVFNNFVSKNIKPIATFHTTWRGFHEYLYSSPFCNLKYKDHIKNKIFNIWRILLEQKVLKNIVNITAVSSGVKREINLWYSNRKVEVINNGINVDEFCPSNNLKKSDTPTIIYVGRLTLQKKGIFLGIDALAKVKCKFNFLVIGEGELRKEVERYCFKKGVPAKFLGRVNREHLKKIYSNSDILLLPSLYEGLPMVGIEGACMGLPIVAFESARVEDIVCEENKPFISRTGDVKTLSNSIQYLIENEYERRTIGRKNREIILKNFTAEKMTEKYIKYYEEVISR